MGNNNIECLNEQTQALQQVRNLLRIICIISLSILVTLIIKF